MKKEVIMEVPVQHPVVSIKAISDDKYYGLISTCLNRKGFIARKDYLENTDYRAFCTKSLTTGNGWFDEHHFDSLEGIIGFAIGIKFKVYQFDTFKELADFLNEE